MYAMFSFAPVLFPGPGATLCCGDAQDKDSLRVLLPPWTVESFNTWAKRHMVLDGYSQGVSIEAAWRQCLPLRFLHRRRRAPASHLTSVRTPLARKRRPGRRGEQQFPGQEYTEPIRREAGGRIVPFMHAHPTNKWSGGVVWSLRGPPSCAHHDRVDGDEALRRKIQPKVIVWARRRCITATEGKGAGKSAHPPHMKASCISTRLRSCRINLDPYYDAVKPHDIEDQTLLEIFKTLVAAFHGPWHVRFKNLHRQHTILAMVPVRPCLHPMVYILFPLCLFT